jgi:hypothetical protein
VGNQLKTEQGKVVRLRGVNVPSLMWDQGEHLEPSLDTAVEWGANLIRLPMNQDLWFGRIKSPGFTAAHYRKTVRTFVEKAAAKKCYVILVLTWSDRGVWGENVGSHKMPDNNSVEFWDSVAAEYANNPAVLLGLYNEPWAITWEVWRNGGKVVENDKKAPDGKVEFDAPGLQKLLEVCRAKGAKNVIVAGGRDWAFDLSGAAKGFALDDPKGNGVVYDTHIYVTKKWYTHGKTKSQEWDRFVASAGEKVPVLIGEFGDGPDDYAAKVLEFADKHGFSWTAWSLHPGAKPCLIKDWKFTPTAFGVVVKDALGAAAAKR